MLKIADEPRMMTNMLQFLLLVSWRRGGKLTVGIADSENYWSSNQTVS